VFQGEREMANDNKRLGEFELTSIPPAPRGVPQIEVTFDIDANGIVNVSARDKATNKEQQITITSSSGLSDADIEAMVQQAEQHKEADKNKKELVEVRNDAESMKYSSEKSLEEHKDKMSQAEQDSVKEALAKLEAALATEDVDAIRDSKNDLATKLGEAIYKNNNDGGSGGDKKGETVDGEYSEKSDKK